METTVAVRSRGHSSLGFEQKLQNVRKPQLGLLDQYMSSESVKCVELWTTGGSATCSFNVWVSPV